MKNCRLILLPVLLVALAAIAVKVSVVSVNAGGMFWGEHAAGITDRIAPAAGEKVLYLTFDACGDSERGLGYEKATIDYLRRHNIPATLFLSAMWIDANPDIFADLAADPLFKIGNHGAEHKPASVRGFSAFGTKGTASKKELVAEVGGGAGKIEKLAGARPNWYRSGQAFYDAESIKIITGQLGIKIAGFAKKLDAGMGGLEDQVYMAAISAAPGDILLGHISHPGRGTAEGLARAIPELQKRGFVFRRLPD